MNNYTKLVIFLLFGAAVTFGALYFTKKPDGNDECPYLPALKKDFKDVLSQEIFTSDQADCIVKEYSMEVEDNPGKIGAAMGYICTQTRGEDGLSPLCKKYLLIEDESKFNLIPKKCGVDH